MITSQTCQVKDASIEQAEKIIKKPHKRIPEKKHWQLIPIKDIEEDLEINLDGFRLSTFPTEIPVEYKEKIKTVNLNNNHFSKLPDQILTLKNLETLTINGNKLTNLAGISSLKNLSHLDLGNNFLYRLPNDISDLNQLEYLNLSHNRIKEEKEIENITELKNITTLDLSKNKLRALPKAIYKLDNTLEILNISENELRELPNEISALSKLKELYVCKNHLDQTPLGLDRLKELEILNLDDNEFEEFPEDVIRIRNLKELHLNSNAIPGIPEDIIKLKRLSDFELKGNRLQGLPNKMTKLRKLKTLKLRGNPIDIEEKKFDDNARKILHHYYRSREGHYSDQVKKASRISAIVLGIGQLFNMFIPAVADLNIKFAEAFIICLAIFVFLFINSKLPKKYKVIKK